MARVDETLIVGEFGGDIVEVDETLIVGEFGGDIVVAHGSASDSNDASGVPREGTLLDDTG